MIESLTNAPSVVHQAEAATRVLRRLTVPCNVIGHAAQVVIAVREATANRIGTVPEVVCDANLAGIMPPEDDGAWRDVECARRPAPVTLCQYRCDGGSVRRTQPLQSSLRKAISVVLVAESNEGLTIRVRTSTTTCFQIGKSVIPSW